MHKLNKRARPRGFIHVESIHRGTCLLKHHGICFGDGCLFRRARNGNDSAEEKQIFHIGVVIGLFHVMMPLVGMAAGHLLSGFLGMLAVYIGGSLLSF